MFKYLEQFYAVFSFNMFFITFNRFSFDCFRICNFDFIEIYQYSKEYFSERRHYIEVEKKYSILGTGSGVFQSYTLWITVI